MLLTIFCSSIKENFSEIISAISSIEFDAILLSSMNLRITAASTPIVSATSFEKERLSDFT